MTATSSGNSGASDQGTAQPSNQSTTSAGPAGVSSGVGTNNAAAAEDPKARYGYRIVLVGLGSVVVLYVATIITFAILTPENVANNVVAAMGAITGVIGSLVAAYFGVQLGAAGKEQADAKATEQAALASAAMGQLNPAESQTAIQNAQAILETRSQ